MSALSSCYQCFRLVSLFQCTRVTDAEPQEDQQAQGKDESLDLAVQYLRPRSRGGLQRQVLLIDLNRSLDILALAQRVGEPGLEESLSRLQLFSCSSQEAQLCLLETLCQQATHGDLLLVHGFPSLRWHGSQAWIKNRLCQLATACGLVFHMTRPYRDMHTNDCQASVGNK